jgi:hypothetical protein
MTGPMRAPSSRAGRASGVHALVGTRGAGRRADRVQAPCLADPGRQPPAQQVGPVPQARAPDADDAGCSARRRPEGSAQGGPSVGTIPGRRPGDVGPYRSGSVAAFTPPTSEQHRRSSLAVRCRRGRPASRVKEQGAILAVDELELTVRVSGILNRWPAVGLAVGVVRNQSLEFFYGHGVADIASNTPSPRTPSFGSPPSPRPSRRSPCCSCGSKGWSTWIRPLTTTCAPTDWFPPRPASGLRPSATC